MLSIVNILSPADFHVEIEKIVNTHNCNYIEAITHYCAKNNLEIETAAALIKSNQKLKSNVQVEGEELKYLKKTTRLPI